ncbi:membrane protein [Nonlabens sp. YIK11]|uniref:hypothetical protein n=1 Tax=Nonlabens sp. YIK11 TaxID=1453349 RepID=UPI0006DC6ADA|nr:hypothetical protein [Nonlabens sp. YIK11]KQC32708.1 membrane protein [Nonlabens sp. YIK11]
METSKILIGYLVYVPLIIGMTFFVSRTLFKNGKIFMLDIFQGQQEIAHSTNKLFEVGFYLLNLGFGLYILEINSYGFDETYQSLVEILSGKIGGFSIYLGFMLFLNLILFFRGRRKSKEAEQRRVEKRTVLENPNKN